MMRFIFSIIGMLSRILEVVWSDMHYDVWHDDKKSCFKVGGAFSSNKIIASKIHEQLMLKYIQIDSLYQQRLKSRGILVPLVRKRKENRLKVVTRKENNVT